MKMADPYKRDWSQDGCNEAEKRLRITSAEDYSSPQRERRSPQRDRRSPQRDKEPKHWKDRGGDLSPSSNSLSSDIMRRLQPVSSVCSGNLDLYQIYILHLSK